MWDRTSSALNLFQPGYPSLIPTRTSRNIWRRARKLFARLMVNGRALSQTSATPLRFKPSISAQLSNSCNVQVVDVTTMYLAKSLGLNVKTLKNSYTYNTNVSLHSFPNGSNSPSQTYLPENEANYPNLEQTYGGSVAVSWLCSLAQPPGATTQVYKVADWLGLISDKLSPGPG